MMKKRIHTAICAITLFIIITPFFYSQQRIKNFSITGVFGDTLRSSVTLKILESLCIGTTLHVQVDLLLDKVFLTSEWNTIVQRIISHFVLMVTGIIYLSCYDQFYMPYLYTCCFSMKSIIPTSVILYSISKGVVSTKWEINHGFFLVPVLCPALSAVMISFSLIYPEYRVFQNILSASYISGIASFVVLEVYWFYSLWRHWRASNHGLEYEETKEMTYMIGLLCAFLTFLVLNSGVQNNSSWSDMDEKSLISYYIMQAVYSIWLTVLPMRFLRTLSEMNESLLRLKREFVRFVSHEIRSPLNVAIAGLEILKADLEAAGVSRAIRNLLEDVSFASNTAIEILNDMLQYEHIDSGTFKLELAVIALDNLFLGRLEAYKFMASSKNIVLTIEDHANVADQGQVSDNDDIESNKIVSADSPDGGGGGDESSTAVTSVLYIDKFRVEQVMRNLVSNAIKFTPESGTIALRFLRIATVDVAVESLHKPIMELQDEAVNKQVNDYLRIEVMDSGAGDHHQHLSGESAEVVQRVHQFNRNALQSGGGSGLGLWICKNLTNLHGGRMHFKSDGEGEGTTFFVDLPVYLRRTANNPALDRVSEGHQQPADDEIVAFLDSNRTPDPNSSSTALLATAPTPTPMPIFPVEEVMKVERPRMQLLIVDDSAPNRKIVRRMVERIENTAVFGDCIILEADDGLTALGIMRKEAQNGRAIDIVLMDYIMINMNGPEAAQRMRTELSFRGVIVGITGNALPEELAFFKASGADSVITKPLTNAKLIGAIGK